MASQNEISVSAALRDLEAGDEPIALTALPRHPLMPEGRSGKRLHVSAAFRYREQGLECVRLGGRWHTTRSALIRFFARASGITPMARTPLRRQREAARADQALEAAGL